MKSMRIVTTGIVGGLLLSVMPTQAGESYWGNASGNYTNAASWQSGGVPQAADSAFFTNDTPFTATFTANWTNDTATFNGPTQLATVDIGSGRIWWLGGQFYVGNAGKTGRVTIGSGTLHVAGTLDLGRGTGTTRNTGSANNQLVVTSGAKVFSGALGLGIYGLESSDAENLLHVTGPGSAVTVEGTLSVGGQFTERGNTVRVSNGGYMAVRDSVANIGSGWATSTNNALIVEGAGSLFELVAITGNRDINGRQNNRIVIRDGGILVTRYEGGTVRQPRLTPRERFQVLIQTGGCFSNTVSSSANYPSFSNYSRCEVSGGSKFYGASYTVFKDDSELIVTGAGSQVAGNNVYFRNNAYFEVSAGASNLFPRTYVGQWDAGDVQMLLTGAGSYSESELHIETGRGRVTVADGAYSKASRFNLAINVGSTGIVAVTGSGSRFESTHATFNTIGSSGIGFMTVTNGGTLQAPSLTVGLNATAAGSELRLYDGTVVCAGTVSATYGKVSVRGTGAVMAPGTLSMATASSELEFIADEAGFSTIRPSTLTVASGAKLTVNAEAWMPDVKVVTNLVSYTSMPTAFSEVSVTVADGYTGSISQGGGSNDAIALTLTPPPRGTAIIIR